MRAIIACMIASKKLCRSIGAAKAMPPEQVLVLLDFSSRLLMPWAGIMFARHAVQDSSDAKFLLEIASRAAMFKCADEEADWNEVLDLVSQRIALVMEEAAVLPQFSQMGLGMMQRVVGHVTDGPWTDGTVHRIPCTRGGDKEEEEEEGYWRSQVDANGVYLSIMSASETSDVVLDAEEGSKIGWYMFMDGSRVQHAVETRWGDLAIIDSQARVRACSGQDLKYSSSQHVFDNQNGWGIADFLSGQDDARFRHGDAYEISFRSRKCKMHRQLHALVQFYQNQKALPAAHGPNAHNGKNCQLLAAWRYFRSAGYESLATVLRDVFCRIFAMLVEAEPEFFRALTCSELESILSQDCLDTRKKEISVLKTAIDWAKHRANTGRHAVKVGDEVRVKQRCANEEWRGEDCLVTCMLPRYEWRVQRQAPMPDLKNDAPTSHATETTVLRRIDMHDAVDTSMLRLIPQVRSAYIPLTELRTDLSNEDVSFASRYACFSDMVKYMAEIQAGEREATDAVPREAYKGVAVINAVDAWTSVLTHAGDPDVIRRHVDEHISRRKLRSPGEVERLIRERVRAGQLFTPQVNKAHPTHTFFSCIYIYIHTHTHKHHIYT
jgi:hypothetical protein